MNYFTTHDGLKLAYEDEGTGKPILCLAGLTRNARDFDDLATVLPDGYRLIRLTSRGRGDSDWAEDYKTYSVPSETRDVIEFLDFLELEKVTIIGTSRGGLIAMVMAATVPDRLSGVLLNDIGPEIPKSAIDTIMEYLGRRPAGRDYAEVAQALQQRMGAEFPDVSVERWRVQAERWFVEQDDGVGLRYDPRLRDASLDLATQPSPDLWPLFDAMADMPVAVLRGANSDLLRADCLEKMSARHPDLIAETVPNRGHVPYLDEPESLKALQRLLEKI